MRVSQHNGRDGSARHNDRDFDVEQAQHIDKAKSSDNLTLQPKKYQGMTFAEAEIAYYREAFTATQNSKNERYRKQGHPERCKTIEQLYHGRLTRPEESILAIGDRNDNVSLDVFTACINDYNARMDRWNKAHGRPYRRLNGAIHVDEQGAIHCHQRRVWVYHDKDGNLCLGQNKALEAAGVELPNPSKPISRYNNRKMTFDRWARQQWQEVCQAHGLQIETEPRADGRKHERTADYIRKDNQRAERERERVQQELQQAQEARQEALQRAQEAQEALQRTQRELEQAQDAVQRKKAAVERLEAEKAALHERLTEAEAELAQTADQKKLIDRLYQKLEKADGARVRIGASDHALLDWEDRTHVKIQRGWTGKPKGVLIDNMEVWHKVDRHLQSVAEASMVVGIARGATDAVAKVAGELAKSPFNTAKKIDNLASQLAKSNQELAAERRARQAAEADAAREAGKVRGAVDRERNQSDKRMQRADRLAPGLQQAEANVARTAKHMGISLDDVIDHITREADALGIDILKHASTDDPARDWRFLTVFDREEERIKQLQRSI